MKRKPNPNDKKILEALKRQKALRGTGWEALFDSSGQLINASIDELRRKATYTHPLESFYKGYTRKIFGPGQTVFTPYRAAIPVVGVSGVSDTFGRLGQGNREPKFRLLGAREKYRLNPRDQTVGILTAGGNAPGLNTVIDSIVKRHSLLATVSGAKQSADGSIRGMKFWGYIGGYLGLVQNNKTPLNVRETDKASLWPGSMLKIQRGETPRQRGAARGIEESVAQKQLAGEMAKAVKRDKLDILYVIGGNGTITAAEWLCRHLRANRVKGEHGKPVRVVAAPKTMDNDVHFTDVTFGFRTTVENAVEFIQRIHLEAETCGRIAVVELFGAGSGFVALHASYASGEVDYVLIPEMMTGKGADAMSEVDQAAKRLVARFKKRGHAILVVAEGAATLSDASLGQFRHGVQAAKMAAFESLVEYLEDRIQKSMQPAKPPRIFTSQPKHLIRSTVPNSEDVDLCKQTGKLMVDTALAGMSRCVVSSWRGRFVAVPMHLAVAKLKQVNVGGYYYISMMERYRL